MPSPREQYGDAMRAGQEAVVTGLQTWVRTTQDLVHRAQELRSGSVQPQQVIDQAAAFAERILHLQRELAGTVEQARAVARDRAGHTGDTVRPHLESMASTVRPYVETAAHLAEHQLEIAREQAERLAEALRDRAEDVVGVARAAVGTVAGAAGLHRESPRADTSSTIPSPDASTEPPPWVRPTDAGPAATDGAERAAPGGNDGEDLARDHSAGGAAAGNTTAGDTTGENSIAGNTAVGNATAENTTAENTTAGNTAEGNTPDGNTAVGNTPDGGTATGDVAPLLLAEAAPRSVAAPGPVDYSGWTKARLQAELAARALPRSGTVAQLRARLEAADRR